MYGKHFGLESPPFRITPDTRRFYPGAQRGAVLEALAYAVEKGEGIVKLTGEVGSGKTMLCRMLADRLATTVDVVYLANPSLKREDVLQAVALDLKLPTDGGRVALLNALQDYLLQRHAEGRRVAVFVEEAQGMDLDALEEIRFLSNLETNEDKLLQIVLFGQPELDDHLAVHAVRQLRDRITHSFTLPPLNLADIRDYIPFRLRAAGYQGGDPLTSMAYRLLARASKGLLRRIHILADKALLAAYADGVRQVHLRHMRRAIDDSEFASGWSLLPQPAWAIAAGMAMLAVGAVTYAVMPHNTVHPNVAELVKIQPAAGVTAVTAAKTTNAAPNPPATPPREQSLSITEDASQRQTAADTALATRVAAARDWLNQDSGALYTIQIMTSDDTARAPLERFLNHPALQAHLDQVYIAPAMVNGTQRWSVLYGSFENYSDAQQAISSIPKALKGYGPYLRSLTAVKKEATGHWRVAQRNL
ncbi:MAG: AAA family ATPase [Gammaproteobacteria bacterium]|nr:AAA family ATPase [Gammaproteobacteria bacterium]